MQEKQQQQTIMFIKVTFKKLTFNLGKNIKTYADLIDQTKARFSELKSFTFFFEEQPITDYNFSTIMKLQAVKGEKSLKIQLKQLEKQKIAIIKQNKSKKYSFNSEEQSKVQKFAFNLDDFEDQEKNMKANQQLQDTFQLLTLTQEDKVSSQKQLQFDLSKIKIKIVIENESESIKTKIGNEYYWTCHLINQSQLQISDQLYVQDLTTKKFIQIYEMKVNDARQMIFGPYTENQAGKYTHFYQIMFKKDENLTYPVGKKFGFVCEVSKKLPVKSIENKMFSKINLLRCFSECEKSTQYIIKKLKQLSINEDSIDNFEDQNLIEIIESLGQK